MSWGGRAGFLTFGLAVMAALVAGILVLMTLLEPAEAAFPGANGRIAFASNRTGNFEIFRMDSDGDSPINLTLTPATDDRRASYSANGKKIVFDSGDLSNNQEI